MNRMTENHRFRLERNEGAHMDSFSILIDFDIQPLTQDKWIQCVFCCSQDFGIIEIALDCLFDEWHIYNDVSI